MEKYVSIGFTKKCHGVKGEIKVQVEEKYLEDFAKSSAIFLLVKGKQLPYFVERIRSGNDLLLKLEDIDSKESAHPLSSKEIFLPSNQILKAEERELEVESSLVFEKYIGFSIVDMEAGEIGKIEEIIEFPQQEMAIIFQEKNEVLIPLHENLIEKIDEEKQYIYMNLPEGLLEL